MRSSTVCAGGRGILRPLVVFKLGGSLLDLPNIGERLSEAFELWNDSRKLLIVGGGPAVDFVRKMYEIHNFSEEDGHWLAIRALVLTSHLVTSLLPGAVVVQTLEEANVHWDQGTIVVLDTLSFLTEEEKGGKVIPHKWEFTSDSIAALVAKVTSASELVLLKSISEDGLTARKAVENGWLDSDFGKTVSNLLPVTWLNFREKKLAPMNLEY